MRFGAEKMLQSSMSMVVSDGKKIDLLNAREGGG